VPVSPCPHVHLSPLKRLRASERRLLRPPDQNLPLRQSREVHRQMRAVDIGLDTDLISQEHLLALVQADLRVRVIDLRHVVGDLGLLILRVVGTLDLAQPGQEVQGAASHAVVLEAQVMRSLDDCVGDEDLRLQGVTLDHLEEVGHALGAIHTRDGQGGAARQRLAESRDDRNHQRLVAGPVFNRQLALRPFRPMTDDDISELVEAADAAILVPFPVQERRVEEGRFLDQFQELTLHLASREIGREGAQDEFGGWQCWVIHKS
jgi:hypothetical protein